MDIILPVMQKNSEKNQIYFECASEVLHTLFTSNKDNIIMIKEYKKPVLDIFNGDVIILEK